MIFEALPSVKAVDITQAGVIENIVTELRAALDDASLIAKPIDKGQNLNFCICSREGTPRYLLRIITRKGYPDPDELARTYQLAAQASLKVPEIVYQEGQGERTPYGFFVQTWLPGRDALDRAGLDKEQWLKSPGEGEWLERCVQLLHRVHTIGMPYFGKLIPNLRYDNLQDYYTDIYDGVSASFGDVLTYRYSIRRIEELGVAAPGFFDRLQDAIIPLTSAIPRDIKPVLIHGDMFPWNIVWDESGEAALIDWDEARAGWFVCEIARTLYYAESKELLRRFLALYGDTEISMDVIESGIKLEHIRQLLRSMAITCFNAEADDGTRARVRKIEEAIIEKLHSRICV